MTTTTKNQTDYHTTILVDSNPAQAMEAIGLVSAWWTANVSGPSKERGDIFTVRFGETYSRFEITEMVRDLRARWLVLDCNLHWMKDKKEWKGTQILWEIVSVKEGTEIHMTHIGLGPQIECFADCTQGWNHYIRESLFKLLNEGKGVPDHSDHSARYKQ